MSIVGTLPANIKNGDAEDANVVMSLFNFIQSQINANAAASGANNDITSLGALTTPRAGFLNRLINGNFSINQLALSGTVTLAAGAYGHDGWKAGAGGCTYTFAASGLDTVITISAGSLLQIVEAAAIEGGIYTLSNKGTAQARIAVNGASTSGAYAALPLASASATGGQAVTVEFSTGTIDRAQLEPGPVATVFERHPPGVDLVICQRYYCTGQALLIGNGATAGAFVGGPIKFPVTMRVAPSVTLGTPTENNNAGGITANPVDTTGFRLYASATAAGSCYYTNTYAASARL